MHRACFEATGNVTRCHHPHRRQSHQPDPPRGAWWRRHKKWPRADARLPSLFLVISNPASRFRWIWQGRKKRQESSQKQREARQREARQGEARQREARQREARQRERKKDEVGKSGIQVRISGWQKRRNTLVRSSS